MVRARDTQKSQVTLVHSDSRAFIPAVTRDTQFLSRSEFSRQCIDNLRTSCNGPVILPTYLYDFPKTKVFNPETMNSDLGALSNFVIRQSGWFREPTPIFSHASPDLNLPLLHDPFGKNSLFAQLYLRQGYLGFFGVGLEAMTFLHHVEHVVKSPYRYRKSFVGKIEIGAESFSHEMEFHVRPPGGMVEYDFRKLTSLIQKLVIPATSAQRSFLISATDAFDLLFEKLSNDSLWLLTQESRLKVLQKLEDIGRDFNLADFE